MRGRIEAERQLDAIAAAQVASGRMAKADADRYIRRLRSAATGPAGRQEIKSAADWAGVGMRVVHEHEKGGEK